MDLAVREAYTAYGRWHGGDSGLSPLVQFVLAKRKFSIECLYAGIYVSQMTSVIGPTDARTLLVYAALLAEQNAGLVPLYYSQSDKDRALVDTLFSASTAFYYVMSGNPMRANLCLQSLDPKLYEPLEWAVDNPEELAVRVPCAVREQMDAAWMLRKPTEQFQDVQTAGAVVGALLAHAIIPDVAAVATLVSSAVRCGCASVLAPVYGMAGQTHRAAASAMVELAVLRTQLSARYPRMHYDVLGTLVRSNDLCGALEVARALRSQQMYHVLLKMWAAHDSASKTNANRCTRRVQDIVQIIDAALDTVGERFLHSTHHLAITTILSAQHGSVPNASCVRAALMMHQKLAPRLVSPSLPAINQLMRAAIGANMGSSAFSLYRDVEARGEQDSSWLTSGPLMATLGEFLAQHEDMRSLVHLSTVVTRRHVTAAPQFYTAVICGLCTQPLHSDQHDLIRRVYGADSILRSMRKARVPRPTKALHAVMYAWAVLGRPMRAQHCFAHLPISDLTEVAWGILMYAFVRQRNARGVLAVLAQARSWLLDNDNEHKVTPNVSSYLVNMSMQALVDRGDGRRAMALLDECLARFAESPAELAATHSDPITLTLVVRTLLASHRVTQAVHVYDDTVEQFGVHETPALLRPFFVHCLLHGDALDALRVVQRVVSLGGTPRDTEWALLVRSLCDARDVLLAYNVWCKSKGVDGTRRVPEHMRQDPELVRCICAALEQRGYKDDATMIGAQCTVLPVVAPAPHVEWTENRSVRLYRDLVREARRFPVATLRAKLEHNVRFVYELYRDVDPRDPCVGALLRDGMFQLRWLRSWHKVPTSTLQAL
ncbi:hypothetical protein GGH12_002621 [Coemansia sp. RSA 1822]|nr:hypothetical protein LPJ76_004808 [Coemansia sp. RSA 638]KAJ2563357.1 hypothetical protein GGH12_002621 [Coemansia sp. RSA 1822]